MIIEVPLSQVPSQSFQIVLNSQNCGLYFTTRLGRVFSDLVIDNVYIWRSVICHDRSPIRQFTVQDLVGNLVFQDQEGANDPQWPYFGTRYRLYYITDDVILDRSFQRRGTDD